MRLRCLPRRPPSHFLLLFSLFAGVPAAVCYLQEYMDCLSPGLFQCGGKQFNVSYPFTAAGRNSYCGFGEHYSLSCHGGVPVIEIDGRSYQVNNIDYETGVLSIADLNLAKSACSPPDGNTSYSSLDWSLFQYTGDGLDLSLHYNCSPLSFAFLPEVSCGDLHGRQSYLTIEGEPNPWAIHLRTSCSSTTLFPLRRTVAESLLNASVSSSSIREAVIEGFDVRWKAGSNWCGDCLASGGACGYNSSAPEAQTCFCPSNSRTGTCPSPNKGTPSACSSSSSRVLSRGRRSIHTAAVLLWLLA